MYGADCTGLHRLVNCGRRPGASLWMVDVNDQICFILTTTKSIARTSASSTCHTYYEHPPRLVSLYLVPRVLHLNFSPRLTIAYLTVPILALWLF